MRSKPVCAKPRNKAPNSCCCRNCTTVRIFASTKVRTNSIAPNRFRVHRLQRIGKLAEELKLVIVASIFERRAAGIYHNTAVVFDCKNEICGKYRKMHIPDDPAYYEKFYFTPGDLGFEPCQTSVGKLGVLVCWDQWYPEAARLMALAGADMLLYPTAIGWDPSDEQAEKDRQREAWITVQRGHAVANGLPLLACNRTGFEAVARRRPRHPILGFEFRRRAARRIHRAGRHRQTRTA